MSTANKRCTHGQFSAFFIDWRWWFINSIWGYINRWCWSTVSFIVLVSFGLWPQRYVSCVVEGTPSRLSRLPDYWSGTGLPGTISRAVTLMAGNQTRQGAKNSTSRHPKWPGGGSSNSLGHPGSSPGVQNATWGLRRSSHFYWGSFLGVDLAPASGPIWPPRLPRSIGSRQQLPN